MPIGFKIDIRKEVDRITRNLDAFAAKQVPFVTARALTATARIVQAAETKALQTEVDRPTPFTLRAFGVIPATKLSLTATVFAKEKQARYLAPMETGGRQVVQKQALLMPIDIARNTYGNIANGALQRMKGNPNVFIGQVETKAGMVGGVWMREGAGAVVTRGKKKGQRIGAATQQGGKLKLMIRFYDPKQLKPVLQYRSRARQIIGANFEREMTKALAAAMRTAR